MGRWVLMLAMLTTEVLSWPASASMRCRDSGKILQLQESFVGQEYVWKLYVPKRHCLKRRPIPLWILAPGTKQSADVALQLARVLPLAQHHGFAVLALQGQDNCLNVEANCLPNPWLRDDVDYVLAGLRKASQRVQIDKHRIFCAGYSRGGRFCCRLGSELSAFVAAIAPVAGLRLPLPRNFTRPVPVQAFHGTADPVNSYWGNAGVPYWGPQPVPDVAKEWSRLNECKKTIYHNTGSVRNIHHTECKHGADVFFASIQGGGHTWPGSPDILPPFLGRTDFSISASNLIQKFFQDHPAPSMCQTARVGDHCYKAVDRIISKIKDGSATGIFASHALIKSRADIQRILRQRFLANCHDPCTDHAESSQVV